MQILCAIKGKKTKKASQKRKLRKKFIFSCINEIFFVLLRRKSVQIKNKQY